MDPGGSDIPSYSIAKLALHVQLHGKGRGNQLLLDALERIVEAADIATGRLVVIDVLDEEVAGFYRRNGFKSIQENSTRLFQKISVIRADLGL
jgi:ribosomal protein S18 acetylase RimI-like enzyme